MIYIHKAVRDRIGDIFVAMYEGDEGAAAVEETVVEPEPVMEVEPPPRATRAPRPPAKASRSAPPAPPANNNNNNGGDGGGSGGFEMKAKLNGHNKQISAVAFSTSDPTLLASGGYDNKV
jgi:hypothetical protein